MSALVSRRNPDFPRTIRPELFELRTAQRRILCEDKIATPKTLARNCSIWLPCRPQGSNRLHRLSAGPAARRRGCAHMDRDRRFPASAPLPSTAPSSSPCCLLTPADDLIRNAPHSPPFRRDRRRTPVRNRAVSLWAFLECCRTTHRIPRLSGRVFGFGWRLKVLDCPPAYTLQAASPCSRAYTSSSQTVSQSRKRSIRAEVWQVGTVGLRSRAPVRLRPYPNG